MSCKRENHCIHCGLPCLGSACRYYSDVIVFYCDDCEINSAEYRIDGDDLCEDCAKERIKEAFDDLTISEQAEVVGIDLSEIND